MNIVEKKDVHVQELFGGALSCILPNNAKDMSTVRDIPDNQEVFAHELTDQSLMVDILEYQTHVTAEQAARYHYFDIASFNDADEDSEVSVIESISSESIRMKQCEEVWYLSGRQMISKFKEKTTARNLVHVHLMLFRLPQYTTDLIVLLNSPVAISKESSSSKSSTSPNCPNTWTLEEFKQISFSLTLNDPSLFGVGLT